MFAEIIAARLQNDDSRARRRDRLKAGEHSGSGVTAYSGVYHMTSITFCAKQKLKLGRECLLRGDALSRGMAGAETYDLSSNRKSGKRRCRKHQQERQGTSGYHGCPPVMNPSFLAAFMFPTAADRWYGSANSRSHCLAQ
jgi:hypothetical protein